MRVCALGRLVNLAGCSVRSPVADVIEYRRLEQRRLLHAGPAAVKNNKAAPDTSNMSSMCCAIPASDCGMLRCAPHLADKSDLLAQPPQRHSPYVYSIHQYLQIPLIWLAAGMQVQHTARRAVSTRKVSMKSTAC